MCLILFFICSFRNYHRWTSCHYVLRVWWSLSSFNTFIFTNNSRFLSLSRNTRRRSSIPYTVAAVTTTLVTTLAPTTTPVATTVTTITTTVQRSSTIGTSSYECPNCFITNMNIFSCLSSCGASSRIVMCTHLPQCGFRIFTCQAPVKQIKSY